MHFQIFGVCMSWKICRNQLPNNVFRKESKVTTEKTWSTCRTEQLKLLVKFMVVVMLMMLTMI